MCLGKEFQMEGLMTENALLLNFVMVPKKAPVLQTSCVCVVWRIGEANMYI